jgi:hypothetical protein
MGGFFFLPSAITFMEATYVLVCRKLDMNNLAASQVGQDTYHISDYISTGRCLVLDN